MFVIFIDDNAHYGEGEHRRKHGTYDTYEEAVAVCKEIINESVREFLDYSNSIQENTDKYNLWGLDPWIVPEPDQCHFSAHQYAKERIKELQK